MTANAHLQKMSHGRGRGLRRTFDTSSESRPGGLKSRGEARAGSHDQSESRSSVETEDSSNVVQVRSQSPIPDSFGISDLVEMVGSLDIDKLEDKKTDHVRKVSRCIKHLCNSDEALRY